MSAYQIVIALLYPDAKTSKNILKQFNSDIEDYDGHFTYNKEDDVYIFEFSESFAYSVKEEQTYRKGEIRYTTGEDESGTGYISSFLTKVAHLGREAREETNKEITIKVVSPLKKVNIC